MLLVENHFDYPRSVCRWAGEEINKFKLAAQTFIDTCEPKSFNQLDLATGEMVHGFEVPEPPDELLKLSYHIIGDLRNALDQAVHAASVIVGTNHATKTNFPVAETPEGVRRRLESPGFKGIPRELHDKIMSFHPYWQTREHRQGDTILRALLEVANPNKHRVPIRVGFEASPTRIGRTENVNRIHMTQLTKTKVEFCRTPAGQPFELDMDFKASIAFDDGPWLAGKMASVVFRLMQIRVENVIDELEGEVSMIEAARG